MLAEHAPQAQDFTHAKGRRNAPLTEEDKRKNRIKSKVRAKVEHVFRVLKCQFGFTKVRYRGLDKNANHLLTAFALVNTVLAKRRLLRPARLHAGFARSGRSPDDQKAEHHRSWKCSTLELVNLFRRKMLQTCRRVSAASLYGSVWINSTLGCDIPARTR